MPMVKVNGVELFYEVEGDGYPLVLVHGSWNDHFGWLGVTPGLAKSFRVVSYDRRGHGASEKPGDGTRRDDEDDLAELITELDIAPAHVAGSSFGASTVLGLVARRPELFRCVIAHEPPLIGIVDDPEGRRLIEEQQSTIEKVLGHVRNGDVAEGARLFVEDVALGPGMWDQLPEPVQATFKANAHTFLGEESDPDWSEIDLEGLSGFSGPVLLSGGDQSPAWFASILEKLATTFKKAQRRTIEGAGHVPHMTHPDAYVAGVTEFIKSSA